jgi:hypothetical protein
MLAGYFIKAAASNQGFWTQSGIRGSSISINCKQRFMRDYNSTHSEGL